MILFNKLNIKNKFKNYLSLIEIKRNISSEIILNIKERKILMNKKIAILCSMLLASSLNIKAVNFKVEVPIEFVISGEDPNHLRAEFSTDYPNSRYPNIRSDFKPGQKWVALPQLVAVYDPENQSFFLLDVKRTIFKIIAQNPERARIAGIKPEDFANAGISGEEIVAFRREEISPQEVHLLAQIFNDLCQGGWSKGFEHILYGGVDVVKGSAKVGLGSGILLKNTTVAIAKFLISWFSAVTESEKEARSNID